MGKQYGDVKIIGTMDNLTFYKMDDIYYVRKKSSLDRKKVLFSPRFKNTRLHASQFSLASSIASSLYRTLGREEKKLKLFSAMVGRAKRLIHLGKTEEEVRRILTEE